MKLAINYYQQQKNSFETESSAPGVRTQDSNANLQAIPSIAELQSNRYEPPVARRNLRKNLSQQEIKPHKSNSQSSIAISYVDPSQSMLILNALTARPQHQPSAELPRVHSRTNFGKQPALAYNLRDIEEFNPFPKRPHAPTTELFTNHTLKSLVRSEEKPPTESAKQLSLSQQRLRNLVAPANTKDTAAKARSISQNKPPDAEARAAEEALHQNLSLNVIIRGHNPTDRTPKPNFKPISQQVRHQSALFKQNQLKLRSKFEKFRLSQIK